MTIIDKNPEQTTAVKATKTWQNKRSNGQAPVVRGLDNAIHWINLYPEDNAIRYAITYPLDSDLSVG